MYPFLTINLLNSWKEKNTNCKNYIQSEIEILKKKDSISRKVHLNTDWNIKENYFIREKIFKKNLNLKCKLNFGKYIFING